MIIEDTQNIIKTGIKPRSNFGNIMIKRQSNTNQDIIKQTLHLFQNIKTDQQKSRNFVKSDNTNHIEKKLSLCGSFYSNEEEANKSDNDYSILEDSQTENAAENDYHSIWDNTDIHLNGVFNLDELNIFQLYKLRSLTYPSKKQIISSNAKILLNFQSIYQIVSEMKKNKRSNKGIITYTTNSPSKFEFNDDDWKYFLNDSMNIYLDINRCESYKVFEGYCNNYFENENKKSRNAKYNRHKSIDYSSISKTQKLRAAEKLKRKFLMEENTDPIQQNENKNSLNSDDVSKNQRIEEVNSSPNLQMINSQNTPQNKPQKIFQIKKTISQQFISSELSQSLSPMKKENKQSTPQISSLFKIQSQFNSSPIVPLNSTRKFQSIDFSNGIKKSSQSKLINCLYENFPSSYINSSTRSAQCSQNNFDSTDIEDEMIKSQSSQKNKQFSIELNENLYFKQTHDSIPELDDQEQVLSQRSPNTLKRYLKNQSLPSQELRLKINSTNNLKHQSTSKLDQKQSASHSNIIMIQSGETPTNSPLKINHSSEFQLKKLQQRNSQIDGNTLPKISTFNPNLHELQKPPVIQNHYQLKNNNTHRMNLLLNDKKSLTSSKSTVKHAFQFDGQVVQNDFSKKFNYYFN